MSEHTPSPQTRNPRIEALRLAAIVGIAVFHTFQSWFAAATGGSWAASPLTLALFGCMSLLGAYGNHVFFLISGHFLVPRAAKASAHPSYWRDQARRTGRRALVIAASVALYAAAALAVSAWVTPLAGVSPHEVGWLVGGLEFIWVYLALVAASPVIGWAWARMRRRHAAVAALVVCVFAVNAYIAFVSPGGAERGLLEWRKLMSAASYLAAFLAGGALAERPPARPGRLLAGCVAVAVAAEGAAAAAGALDVLAALSFKSTSLLSFALAACSVAFAARRPPAAATSRASSLVCRLTPSILGFYVAQSVFSPLWRPAVEALTQAVAPAGEAALVAVGVALSLALLAGILLADQLVRVPLLRRLRLA